MPVKVYINGDIFDEQDAVIPVFDRGFLYGDSVYEVIRTSGGVPVDLEPHLERLSRSAHSIALDPPSPEVLHQALARTLAAAGNHESYLRIIATRGRGAIGLDTSLAEDPLTIVIVKPLVQPAPELYRDGVALAIVGVERTSSRSVDPSVKSGNYLNNILALHEARRAGAYEALMCDATGQIAEGSTSNLFIVSAGRLLTPATEVGILEGITRRRVMLLASEAGISVSEGNLMPADVRCADESFITSSIRGILPVARVDGVALGSAGPGPVTGRLMSLYDEYLRRVARQG